MKSRIARRAVTVVTAVAALAAAGGLALAATGTAAAATPVAACATAGLSADFQLQPNLGDRPETEGAALIMLTNTSKRTCTVRGYVGLGYVDAKNTHHNATANRSKEIPVTTITLKPGRTAFAGANFVSQPYGCATAAKALVTPPNQTTSLVTPFLSAQGGGKRQSITLCGGKFNVTALAPTPSAIGIFS